MDRFGAIADRNYRFYDYYGQAEAERVVAILAALGFRLWDATFDLRDADGHRQVYAGLTQFREHLGGGLTLAMPAGLGSRADISAFSEDLCEEALVDLRRLSRRRPAVIPLR